MSQQSTATPESQLIEQRLKKLERIRDMGVDPYPYRFERSHTMDALREDFATIQVMDNQKVNLIYT